MLVRKKRKPLVYLVRGGIIAALYIVLTYAAAPISFGAVQVRVSEALTLLPLYFPEAVPALFVGCIISNLISNPIDIILGSFATLIAAYLSSKMRNKFTAAIPPVIINAVIVGAMLSAVALLGDSGGAKTFYTLFAVNALTVGVGEAVACFGLGIPLCYAIEKYMSKNRTEYL